LSMPKIRPELEKGKGVQNLKKHDRMLQKRNVAEQGG